MIDMALPYLLVLELCNYISSLLRRTKCQRNPGRSRWPQYQERRGNRTGIQWNMHPCYLASYNGCILWIFCITYNFAFQIRNVRSIIMHPDYDDRTYSNDICLLELDEPFYMDEYVRFYLNSLLKLILWGGASVLVTHIFFV